MSQYDSIEQRLTDGRVSRRAVLRAGAIGAGAVLGAPPVWSQEKKEKRRTPPDRPKTNIEDALQVPRTKLSLPGLCPGRVVHVQDKRSVRDGQFDGEVIAKMYQRGLRELMRCEPAESFSKLFDKDDVVGIKVNPVGPGLINTRLEVVDAIIDWLTAQGLPRKNIVIWDRFDYMLADAGYTAERFPGVQIEGLQTMVMTADEKALAEDTKWRDAEGNHVSAPNFDRDVYYYADVEGPKDLPYLNQHVFNGKYSYFGKLLTQRLTKIINVPVFKNAGNGISMATKNLGYGAVCNTNRLHRPLFFDVCVEVLAFPAIRDKLVLNVIDGLRAQYDGGPMPAPQFAYDYHSLFFATDPFAVDVVGHKRMVDKRKDMGVKVSEHPRYTEYFRYADKLRLGVTDPARMKVLEIHGVDNA